MALGYPLQIQQSTSEWHFMPSSVGRCTSKRNKGDCKSNSEKCTDCSDADPNCQCTISCSYINKCCDQYGHMMSHYGDVRKKKSNIDIIQQYQNKVLRCLVSAPWYARNSDIHHELGVENSRTHHRKTCYRTWKSSSASRQWRSIQASQWDESNGLNLSS
jgi:hypothetical protein